MKLLEVCDPLFQCICRLKRLGHSGRPVECDQVRVEIKKIFKVMKEHAIKYPELGDSYQKIEYPLVFFVDFMMKGKQVHLTSSWSELALEWWGELAGDEKFFDLLDETLKESGEQANERLSIFYTCLGLGFTGFHTGDTETLRTYVQKIIFRIAGMMDLDERAFICPEAYENVDSRNLYQPPTRKLGFIVFTLISLLVVWTLVYVFVFKKDAKGIEDGINSFNKRLPENIVEVKKTSDQL